MADGADRPFAARRDRHGRFLKGASGNPSGRPPGILNEATRTAAVLLGGEAGALTRKAIELGLSGDIAALRLCIDRIIAPRREQPVAFAMPQIDQAGDLPAAMVALTRAAAIGGLTPAEAAALAQVVGAHARVIETTARVEAERLAARQAEIAIRCDLRICVVMAHRLQGGGEAGDADSAIAERCAELRRIGARRSTRSPPSRTRRIWSMPIAALSPCTRCPSTACRTRSVRKWARCGAAFRSISIVPPNSTATRNPPDPSQKDQVSGKRDATHGWHSVRALPTEIPRRKLCLSDQ